MDFVSTQLIVSLELDYLSSTTRVQDQECPLQVHTKPYLGSSPKSYAWASVPSFPSSDRYIDALDAGHAVEQRSNKVHYVILDSIDPTTTEQEVYALLLQAIQDVHLAGYWPLFPSHMPELATPPPMWVDTFSNWEAELFIPNTPVHLSFEQLPEVVVAEGLG